MRTRLFRTALQVYRILLTICGLLFLLCVLSIGLTRPGSLRSYATACISTIADLVDETYQKNTRAADYYESIANDLRTKVRTAEHAADRAATALKATESARVAAEAKNAELANELHEETERRRSFQRYVITWKQRYEAGISEKKPATSPASVTLMRGEFIRIKDQTVAYQGFSASTRGSQKITTYHFMIDGRDEDLRFGERGTLFKLVRTNGYGIVTLEF